MRQGPRRLRPAMGAAHGELGPGGFPASRRRSPVRPLRLWLLLLVLAAGALVGLYLLWREATGPSVGAKEEQIGGPQLSHKPRSLSSSQLKRLASLVDLRRLWHSYLQPILIERYPGSSGSNQVRQFITERLKGLAASWHVELDSFEDQTPRGTVSFANVVATLDPAATRRLVLACHYDSKYFPHDRHGRAFLGATDSAVPCSILLELVTALDQELLSSKEQGSQVSLQLLFLDGEEAFGEWSDTDSLYGARHLAEHMARTSVRPGVTQLQAMKDGYIAWVSWCPTPKSSCILADIPFTALSKMTMFPSSKEVSRSFTSSPHLSPSSGIPWRTRRETCTDPQWRTCVRSWQLLWQNTCGCKGICCT